jgi:hypothetical protein
MGGYLPIFYLPPPHGKWSQRKPAAIPIIIDGGLTTQNPSGGGAMAKKAVILALIFAFACPVHIFSWEIPTDSHFYEVEGRGSEIPLGDPDSSDSAWEYSDFEINDYELAADWETSDTREPIPATDRLNRTEPIRPPSGRGIVSASALIPVAPASIVIPMPTSGKGSWLYLDIFRHYLRNCPQELLPESMIHGLIRIESERALMSLRIPFCSFTASSKRALLPVLPASDGKAEPVIRKDGKILRLY